MSTDIPQVTVLDNDQDQSSRSQDRCIQSKSGPGLKMKLHIEPKRKNGDLEMSEMSVTDIHDIEFKENRDAETPTKKNLLEAEEEEDKLEESTLPPGIEAKWVTFFLCI